MSHDTEQQSEPSLPNPTVETGEYSIESMVDAFGDDAVSVHEISFPDEVALKQLSEHKYESLFGMFREYLANAEATTLEARDTLGEEYNPLIHVGHYKQRKVIQIVDNGMGMEKELIDKMSEGGNTTNWSNDSRPGRFGIGRFSAFKGVGTDGGFYMETRSRRTDERTTGFWTGNEFIEVDNMEPRMDEEQYGTFFEFPLRSETNVREHVSKASWWFEIPVQYTEYNGKNTPVFDDEYGGTKFLENANPSDVVVFENEYVKAVNAPRRNKTKNIEAGIGNTKLAPKIKTTVLDVPINRNNDSTYYNLPYSKIYVRIKKESQYVVDNSEHVGKILLSTADYQKKRAEGIDMSRYVSEAHIEDCAIILPMPAGDRDRLQKNEPFWDWLETKLLEVYCSNVELFVSQFNEHKSYHDIDAPVRHFIIRTLKSNALTTESKHARKNEGVNKTINKMENRFGVTFDTDVKTLLRDMFQHVTLCTESHEKETSLYDVLENQVSSTGTVFMSYVSPDEKKKRVVWEDSSDHALIKITNSELYNEYTDLYNFRKIKTITHETIDEFDVPNELADQFTPSQTTPKTSKNAGKSPQNRELTVHNQYGHKKRTSFSLSWSSTRKTITSDELQETVTNPESRINHAVLIPSNSEYNISDVKDTITWRNCYTARCSVKTADYLTQFDNIQTIEQYIDDYYNTTVKTSDGMYQWDELTRTFANIFVHVPVDEEIKQLVQSDTGMKIAKEQFINIRRNDNSKKTPENTVYVPLDTQTLEQLYIGTAIVDPPTKVYFMHKHNVDDDSHQSLYLPSKRFTHKSVFSNPTWLYTHIRLTHIDNQPIKERLQNKKYNEKTQAIIDMLCEVDAETAQQIIRTRFNE